MKKGWKIFWVVCGTTAFAGVAFTVTGLVLGASAIGAESARLISGWIRDGGLEELTAEGLAALDEIGESLDEAGNGVAEPRKIFADQTYTPPEANGTTVKSFDGVERLEVDVPDTAVSIRTYPGETVLVDTDSLTEEMRRDLEILSDGKELRVDLDHEWYLDGENIIYISIPEKLALKEVSAEIGGGWLEVSGVEAEEISVEIGAGQGIVRSFTAEKIVADCGAGQLIVEGSGQKLTEIGCNTGEVILTVPGDESDYDYEVDCNIGEVVIGGEYYDGIRNRIEAGNDSGRTIKAECDIGRLEIIFDPDNVQ